MDIFPEIDSAYERLENGLEVRHIRCRYFAAVGISVVVRTGNIHEGAMCGCGVSHFAEHMAFVGAGGRREESVSADAAMFGAELNAYTSHDRTVYFADCPTESLGKTLSLLSEMLFEPNFTEGAFEKERDVILREIDMCSDDAGEKVYDNLFRKMYISSPLRYPVIGLKKSLWECGRPICADIFRTGTARTICAFAWRRHSGIPRFSMRCQGLLGEGAEISNLSWLSRSFRSSARAKSWNIQIATSRNVCWLLKCRAEIPWSPLSGIAPRCLLAKVIRPY